MKTPKTQQVHSEIMAEKIATWVTHESSADEIQYLKIKLGAEVMIINISKALVVYLVAILFRTLIPTVITHLAYASVRKFSQGLHAKSSVVCTVVSILMFVAIPCLMKTVIIDRWMVLLIGVAITYLFYRYAPADTEKCPIIDPDIRRQLKLKAVGMSTVILCVALMISNPMTRSLLIVGLVLQVVMTLPITYKLLKRSYNNYEKYEA